MRLKESSVRISQKKQRSRKFLLLKRFIQGVSCTFIFFAVGYFFFWCLDPSQFPILSVKLIGDRTHLTQSELRDVVSPEIKAGFFGLKVSSLQQQLLLLPWVKQVNIRKVWPDQLEIRFEEHVPAALWRNDGVLSTEGVLFHPDMKVAGLSQLPILEGPIGRHSLVWEQYLTLEKLLAPLDLKITQCVLAARGAWHLGLSNGITVVLGTNERLKRLEHFVNAYKAQLYLRKDQIAYVDLRYTNGMAVGWKNS